MNICADNKNKAIRWAVCGLGRISHKFTEAVSLVNGAKIVAAASSDKERAKEFAGKYKLGAFGTYDEIAERKDIDAVYISTNMSDHAPVAKLFLSRGVPCLIEKSIAQNLTETLEIFKAAESADTLVMEAMWTRFLPATEKVIELTLSGGLGKMKRIKSSFDCNMTLSGKSRVFSNAAGGGSILDLGVYNAAYAHMLMGAPEKISAAGTVKNGVDVECSLLLEYGGGVKAELHSSLVSLRPRTHMSLEFENGAIDIPDFLSAQSFTVKKAGEKKEEYKFPFSNGFTFEIEHFNGLIRNGLKESPVWSKAATAQVMDVLTKANDALGVSFISKDSL